MYAYIISCLTHGLLAHGTLVGVPGGLVVVGVGNQASTYAQDGERLNLQVGCVTAMFTHCSFMLGIIMYINFICTLNYPELHYLGIWII